MIIPNMVGVPPPMAEIGCSLGVLGGVGSLFTPPHTASYIDSNVYHVTFESI